MADTQVRTMRYRLWPILVVTVSTAIIVGAKVFPNTNVSSSNLSLIKMGTIIVGVVLLLVWALRFSGWPRRRVWLFAISPPALFLAFYKPLSMDGQFFPIFGLRDWVYNVFLGGKHDQLLAKQREEQPPVVIEGGVQLVIGPKDMPTFRGMNRDGIVASSTLARDWNTQPPREVWRHLIGGGYAAFVSANGYLVTIEQRDDNEVVACYEAATGLEIWKTTWPGRFDESAGGVGPRATPAIAHGKVYAYGASGRLVCLDGNDGREIWAVNTLDGNQNLRWAMSGSPLIVGDMVIVNPGSQTESSRGRAILAYDCATGQERWASGNYVGSYSSPQLATLHGIEQLLIFDGHGLAGHELKNGKQLWRTPWKTDFDINVAQPIVVDQQSICIGSGYNHGGALIRISKDGETWSAKEVWKSKNTVMRWKFASAVRRSDDRGDFVYGLNDGLLECVDLKTGKPMWKDDRRARKGDGYGHGQLLLCDDRIIVLTEYGELVLVEATSESFRELGRIQALNKGPKTWNTPMMIDGKIYIRNEVEMACYDLRAGQ